MLLVSICSHQEISCETSVFNFAYLSTGNLSNLSLTLTWSFSILYQTGFSVDLLAPFFLTLSLPLLERYKFTIKPYFLPVHMQLKRHYQASNSISYHKSLHAGNSNLKYGL